jgi:uroporphyrinogen III methyltransferase / synthase
MSEHAMSGSLAGLRVAVTRSIDDCADWAARLAQAGAEPIVYPCIRTETLGGPALAAELGAAVADADWVVFTSRRGVEAFAAAVTEESLRAKVAVVGKATGAAARAALGRADFVATGGTAAALGAELAVDDAFGDAPSIVIAVAENAGPALQSTLARAGARCRRFDVYRTVAEPAREPRESLAALALDAVLFASPSAVTGFLNQVAIDGPLRAVSIGPSTSAALRAAALAVTVEAREPSLDSMLDSMSDAVHDSTHGANPAATPETGAPTAASTAERKTRNA